MLVSGIDAPVKSIQEIDLSFTTLNNWSINGENIDHTIAEVDADHSIILVHASPSVNNPSTAFVLDTRLLFNGPTILRLYHACNHASESIDMAAYVVEFYPSAIKSLQYLVEGVNPITINSVNVAKTVFIPNSYVLRTYNATWYWSGGPCHAAIASATTANWSDALLTSAANTYGQILEFR